MEKCIIYKCNDIKKSSFDPWTWHVNTMVSGDLCFISKFFNKFCAIDNNSEYK